MFSCQKEEKPVQYLVCENGNSIDVEIGRM